MWIPEIKIIPRKTWCPKYLIETAVFSLGLDCLLKHPKSKFKIYPPPKLKTSYSSHFSGLMFFPSPTPSFHITSFNAKRGRCTEAFTPGRCPARRKSSTAKLAKRWSGDSMAWQLWQVETYPPRGFGESKDFKGWNEGRIHQGFGTRWNQKKLTNWTIFFWVGVGGWYLKIIMVMAVVFNAYSPKDHLSTYHKCVHPCNCILVHIDNTW